MYANHQRLGQPDTSIDTSAARSELLGYDNDYVGEVDVRIQHGDQVGDRATSPVRPIPPKAPRVRKAMQDWDTHKSEIIECYMEKGWPLEDVREHMKDRHGFDATAKQYKAQLKNWYCIKNLSKDQAQWMVEKADRRKRLEGKDTEFHVGSTKRKWSTAQAEASLKRTRVEPGEVNPMGGDVRTPSGFVYNTPNVTAETPPSTARADVPGILTAERPPIESYHERQDGPASLSITWNGHSKTDLDVLFRSAKEAARQGRSEEALRCFEQSLVGFRTVLGPTHEETAIVIFEAASFYASQGDMARADRILDASTAAYIKQWGMHDNRTYGHVLQIIELLTAWHRHDEALAYASHAFALYKQADRVEHNGLAIGTPLEAQTTMEAQLPNTENMMDSLVPGVGPAQLDYTLRVARTQVLDDNIAAERLLQAIIQACAWDPVATATQSLSAHNNLLKHYQRTQRFDDQDSHIPRAKSTVEASLREFPWNKKNVKSFEVMRSCLELAATVLKISVLTTTADDMFRMLANKTEEVWGPDHKTSIWVFITTGTAYQHVLSWNSAKRWFERALAGALHSLEEDDGILRSLEHAMEVNYFSYLGDEGRPFSSVFGVTGLTIRPARLHL